MISVIIQFGTFLIILISGIVLSRFGYIYQWVGGGLIAGSLGLACMLYRRYLLNDASRWKSSLSAGPVLDFAAVSFLIFLSLVMFDGLYFGTVLRSYDHNIHYVQALEFKKALLNHGHAWGWTNGRFAGLPVSYTYPFSAYLWVLAVDSLMLGLVPFKISYTLSVILMYLSCSVAVYFLGKKVSDSRIVGLMAAAIYLTDRGAYQIGGWYYTVFVGVWPVHLSVLFCLLAVIQFDQVLNGGKQEGRSAGWFGLFMGFAILCHPLAAGFFLLFIPVGYISIWSHKARDMSFKNADRIIIASASGFFIGALFMLPFAYFRHYTATAGAGWHTYNGIAQMIFLGKLADMSAYKTVLGFLGCLLMLFSNRALAFLAGLLAFAFLIVVSATLVNGLQLYSRFPGIKDAIFIRFVMLSKPFWIIGCAWMIGVICQVIFKTITGPVACGETAAGFRGRAARHLGKWFLVGLFLFPVFIQVGRSYYDNMLPKHNQYLSGDGPYQADIVQIIRKVDEVKSGDARFFRVGFEKPILSQRVAGIVYDWPVPVHLFTAMPANCFKYKMETDHLDALDILNVRFFITKSAYQSPMLRLVKKYEVLYLYENLAWRSEPFTLIEGQADVRTLAFQDEEIVLEAKPGSAGRLMLHVSYFPGWKATLNGRPIQTYPTILWKDFSNAFVTLDLKGGGTYRVFFQIGLVEKCAFLVFVLGLLLVLLNIFYSSRRGQNDLRKVR